MAVAVIRMEKENTMQKGVFKLEGKDTDKNVSSYMWIYSVDIALTYTNRYLLVGGCVIHC